MATGCHIILIRTFRHRADLSRGCTSDNLITSMRLLHGSRRIQPNPRDQKALIDLVRVRDLRPGTHLLTARLVSPLFFQAHHSLRVSRATVITVGRRRSSHLASSMSPFPTGFDLDPNSQCRYNCSILLALAHLLWALNRQLRLTVDSLRGLTPLRHRICTSQLLHQRHHTFLPMGTFSCPIPLGSVSLLIINSLRDQRMAMFIISKGLLVQRRRPVDLAHPFFNTSNSKCPCLILGRINPLMVLRAIRRV